MFAALQRYNYSTVFYVFLHKMKYPKAKTELLKNKNNTAPKAFL